MDNWGWTIDHKSGKQTLSVPKKAAYTFQELMTVQIAAVDFLKTIQSLIMAQVTGQDPEGRPLPSRKRLNFKTETKPDGYCGLAGKP